MAEGQCTRREEDGDGEPENECENNQFQLLTSIHSRAEQIFSGLACLWHTPPTTSPLLAIVYRSRLRKVSRKTGTS